MPGAHPRKIVGDDPDPRDVYLHAGEQPQPATGARGEAAAHIAGNLVPRKFGNLPTLAGGCHLVPARKVLAGHPLTRELQRRSAVVDDSDLGDLRNADDHLDDTRVGVADDQPPYARQLTGHGTHAAGNSHAAQPWFVPGDLMANLAREGDHRPQLGTGDAGARCQHCDLHCR